MKFLMATLLSGLIISSMCAAGNDQPTVNSWSGAYSGINQQKEVVIRDTENWQKLWAEVHSNAEPVPPVPAIDFSTHMVVGYFLGQKPSGGYSVAIESITEDEGKTVVSLSIKFPGRSSIVTQAITSPYVLQATAKTDKEVIFKTAF